MRERAGDLWKLQQEFGTWVVVTTNTTLKSNGELVMGKGIALQAAQRYPYLPSWMGFWVREKGELPAIWDGIRIVCLPTKRDWRDPSPLDLIEKGIGWLKQWNAMHNYKVLLPPLGCGHGGRKLEEILSLLRQLPDNFFLVHAGR